MQGTLQKCFATGILLAAWVCWLQAAAPHGWFLAGSKPANYETGIDPEASYHDAHSAFLKSKTPDLENEGSGFGTLMQSFRAEQYLGKRVRLTGYIKSAAVREWAGLWMRVDKGSSSVAFDNMQDRAIKGTTDWHRYEVVLDVPKDATGISFGVLLAGPGAVWLNSTSFEVVESDVPTTGRDGGTLPDRPTNLNFKE
ncbi:MAG TPA: hypothetical protein VG498_04550 [Terriglobales bacterium]|nr:hypothetical protein [Terriglobales bacterium]